MQQEDVFWDPCGSYKQRPTQAQVFCKLGALEIGIKLIFLRVKYWIELMKNFIVVFVFLYEYILYKISWKSFDVLDLKIHCFNYNCGRRPVVDGTKYLTIVFNCLIRNSFVRFPIIGFLCSHSRNLIVRMCLTYMARCNWRNGQQPLWRNFHWLWRRYSIYVLLQFLK